MIKDNLIYLDHILESLDKIQSYSENLSLEDFIANTMVQDALIRQFEVIGEASKGISNDLKLKYAEVDWVKISGMRNKLIHEYFDIDLNILWKAIQHDVPALKTVVRKMLDNSEKGTL